MANARETGSRRQKLASIPLAGFLWLATAIGGLAETPPLPGQDRPLDSHILPAVR